MADYRMQIRKMTFRDGKILSSAKNKEQSSVYEMYYDFSEPLSKIPSHRVLAINRGENEGVLKAKIDIEPEEIISFLESNVITGDSIFKDELKNCIMDSYKRLISPSI